MKKVIPILGVLAVLLLLVPTNSITQQADEKVYWMATFEVPLVNLEKFHASISQEFVPLAEKHGYHIIAGWQTIVGNIEEVILVAEFENMGAYHKARVSLLTSEEWKSFNEKYGTLSRGIKTRFMSALPYISVEK